MLQWGGEKKPVKFAIELQDCVSLDFREQVKAGYSTSLLTAQIHTDHSFKIFLPNVLIKFFVKLKNHPSAISLFIYWSSTNPFQNFTVLYLGLFSHSWFISYHSLQMTMSLLLSTLKGMSLSLCSSLTLSLIPRSYCFHSLSKDTNCWCSISQSPKDDWLTKNQYLARGRTDSGKGHPCFPQWHHSINQHFCMTVPWGSEKCYLKVF